LKLSCNCASWKDDSVEFNYIFEIFVLVKEMLNVVADNISMPGSDTFAFFSLMRLSLITFD